MEGIDWGQLGKSLIGQSDRQVLDRESDKYRGPGTEVKREGIEKIMDAVFRGGSSASLNTLSQDDYVESLQDNYGTRLELISPEVRQRLGIPNRQGLTHKMSEADVARQVKAGEALEDALRRAKATRGIKPEVLASSDPAVIEQGIQDAEVQQGNKDYTNSPEYRDMKEQQNLTNKLAIGQLALSQQTTANQMKMAMMDNQLERRRQDMQERSNDRKDRQQMILMLMKGLSNIGQSIAI